MYRVVGKQWRKRVEPRKKKHLKPLTNPAMVDLLAGKTLLIERDLWNAQKHTHWYTLFLSRGYNLRIYEVDDVSQEIYRAKLMWLDKLK